MFRILSNILKLILLLSFINYRLFYYIWGGQFAPELYGQFAPERGGQFSPELGGQFGRNIHIIVCNT